MNRAVLIEAFSDGPFGGNGAAVVLLDRPAPAVWMQRLAASLKQSETAFMLKDGSDWLLRWFTPSCEVALCGHATLASLLALGHWQLLQPGDSLELWTRSGPLSVSLDGANPCRGSVVLPSGELHPAPVPAGLQHLLTERFGSGPEAFWTSALGYAVALLKPGLDLAAMACMASELPKEVLCGLVLMQPLDETTPLCPTRPRQLEGLDLDFQLRFFAPGLGIDEDPVTGSAHALVAPWWHRRLQRDWVAGWQCSDRPGGVVSRATSSGMIRLFGSGHLLWDGTLLTEPQGNGAAGTNSSTSLDSNDDGSWRGLRPES
ncbi:MAG: PhzF family phenazine biosynthesis protein [Synechococcaceae cyanobacterium ELA739]